MALTENLYLDKDDVAFVGGEVAKAGDFYKDAALPPVQVPGTGFTFDRTKTQSLRSGGRLGLYGSLDAVFRFKRQAGQMNILELHEGSRVFFLDVGRDPKALVGWTADGGGLYQFEFETPSQGVDHELGIRIDDLGVDIWVDGAKKSATLLGSPPATPFGFMTPRVTVGSLEPTKAFGGVIYGARIFGENLGPEFGGFFVGEAAAL